MENGRKQDVLIENDGENFTVWADKEMRETIEAVEGVTHAFNVSRDTRFSVYVDKRYDREIVKREIELAIIRKMYGVKF